MRAVVVYEPASATRLVAQAVALSLDPSLSVLVLRPSEVYSSLLDGADLLVVGGPAEIAWATAPGSARQYEVVSPRCPAVRPNALNWLGVREWIGSLDQIARSGATFDTRVRGRSVFVRRASKGNARELAQHGMPVIVPPASFLVEETGQPAPNETKRAEARGAHLGGVLRARRAAG
jgi:hypothetical protein